LNHNTPQRLRITEPGWALFTDYFGGVPFENGLSVHPVDPITAMRLGSLIQIELVDTGEQAGKAAELVAMHDTAAAVVTPVPAATEADMAPKVEAPLVPKHTRESLEAIADGKGIAGLRDIATPMGIKSNSIPDLIEKILKAQGPQA
jgi:hypothetical protein